HDDRYPQLRGPGDSAMLVTAFVVQYSEHSMGSRPPRQQSLPRPPRQHQPDLEDGAQGGISMEIVTPLIGFSIFPVALGAAFIGYGASGDTTAISAALVITFVIAGGLWAF